MLPGRNIDVSVILPFGDDEDVIGVAVQRVAAYLDAQKLELAQEHARWTISNLLHGEQGALSLSLTLGELFSDPAAQEYAANQAREEARHVHGFTRYIGARFGGEVAPVGETLARFAIVNPETSTDDIAAILDTMG